MAKLDFSSQTTRKQPVRTAPGRFLTSKLRRELEVSDGMRPRGAYYPWRYLPVQFKDVETNDWVVILKGRVVSLLTNQQANIGDTAGPSGAMANISASGTIYTYDDATTAAVDYKTVNIDDSYFGYHDSAAGLLIPANGGNQGVYTYSADDVTAGVLDHNTGAVVVANDTVDVAENFPVGVVYQDVYQDLAGRWLNYDLMDRIYGILADGLIMVPYVDYGDTTPQSTATFAAAWVTDFTVSSTADAGYNATYRKHTFFYFDSAADEEAGMAGKWVAPDAYGNYVTLDGEASGEGSIDSFKAGLTEQAVGKVLVTDARWPKDNMELVDTYYNSGLYGTETGGVPSVLYNFAHDAMVGMSLGHQITEVVDMIQSGVFGMAYIQLSM